MTRTTKIVVVVLALVLTVVVAIAAYVIVNNRNAPEALQLSTPTAAQSGDFSSQQLDGVWTISSDSVAGYRVDEVLTGQDVTVVGRTEKVSGDVTIADQVVTAASISVDMASVATDNSNRDDAFRDLLKTQEFASTSFTLTEELKLEFAENISTGETRVYNAVGTLEVAGVQQKVTAVIDARFSETGIELVGTIPVTFSDFDIKAPNLGFVTVEDSGSVEFSLNLVRS
ncbi:YceI family protein [Timonella sp. A28]|uniref:YceI family protein n=1 Tax=Timonella sp. A28 TaxID=3442640 RepID=UPI003EC00B43